MSFPRYPKYKDCSLDALGEVPDHWAVKRLRFVVQLNPSKAEIASLDRKIMVSFLPMEAIGDDGTTNLANEKTIGEVETGYTYFRDGDVTLAKITPCYENGKGALMRGLTNGIGFGTTELIVARPRPDEIVAPFLHLLFSSTRFRSEGEAHMYGAGGQKRVPDAFVRNFAMALPTLAEQAKIVTFLNQEAEKIDTLITEQRRLIELLQEKRQAIISHAVTKGLNSDAPMKPSGIEWLGDVPAHWVVVALKRVAVVRTGIAKGKDYGTQRTIAVPYLRVANVQDGYLDLESVATIEIPDQDLERYALKPGDVLMNEGGDFDKLGRGHVWDGQINPCITQNHVFAVRPHKISPAWLNTITGSAYAQFYFMSKSKQSTNLASISSTNLMELPVVLPPSSEQSEILSFVEGYISDSNALVVQAQKSIDLLHERRAALISAAVTGQIDVRAFGERKAA